MKLTFDLHRNVLSIEGDSPDMLAILQEVKTIAPKISEIRIVTGASNVQAANDDESKKGGNGGGNQGAMGLREFARSLAPSNMAEKIVAVAAYKSRHENIHDFSPMEMGVFFMQCNFEKPSQMAVAIFDAKRKYGYLEKAVHGRWRLSTAGQNLVARRLEESRSTES